MEATLYYVYDPMCSWCWGFKQTWQALEQRLQDKLQIRYVLGGLAPETEDAMSEDMQASLQQTWHRVHEMTGAQFNFDFWRNNTPRRSTYPACKAVLVARRFGRERQMYERIQHYYYQEAGNPSLYDNLIRLAVELGMDEEDVRHLIHSDEIEQALMQEIMYAEQLGAQGFPSLILEHDGRLDFIQHSYVDVDANYQTIISCLNNAEAGNDAG